MVDLSLDEKIEIVHKALIQHLSYSDISKLHEVKPALIGSLVKKSMADNNFFAELRQIKVKKERMAEVIEETANEFLEEHSLIFNSHQIYQKVNEKIEGKVTKRQISFILKNKLGLTYRKLGRIEVHANSAMNLILRAKCGKTVLDKLSQGKRFINIDESWINVKDFRRKCWRKRYTSNTVGTSAVHPRITFMVAIDTDGSVFFAVSSVNTDTNSKRLLLHELCNALDKDRPDWRETSVCIMDNAPYNKSAETMEYIQKLKMPMIFLGKYSYSASPCEFFFAYFKREIIYEANTPTGKR